MLNNPYHEHIFMGEILRIDKKGDIHLLVARSKFLGFFFILLE